MSNLFQTDEDVLMRYRELRADAIRCSIEANEKAFPEIYARFSEAGRNACVQELTLQLDFLRPTLETGDISPFITYLAWLVDVLTSRGVPLQVVTRSLDDLGLFFETKLGVQATPIIAALSSGKEALSSGIPAPVIGASPSRWKEAEVYSEAALRGRQDDAIALLEDAFTRAGSLPLVAVNVIQPAMYDVGRLWQENRVSVAQEHLATATSESWLAQSMARVKAAPDNGKRAVFAAAAGNQHILGLNMVADAFELDGWVVDNLGADTPIETLVVHVRDTRPHLVGLSATLPQHLWGLRQTVDRLGQAFGDACPRIAVGGLAINQFPGLAGWVGAEVLGPDALAAVAAEHPCH
jgi:methanogenic corrinoid protein MtbC1